MNNLLTMLLVLVCIACQPVTPSPALHIDSLPPSVESTGPITSVAQPTPASPEEIRTRDIVQAIEICGSSMSDARKQIVASQLYRVTTKYLSKKVEWADAFVGIVCVESKFDTTAKSVVGATGMSQIMPKLAGFFAEECGLGKISEVDLLDTETNLTVGACHFSKLIESFNGNLALAFSGYNSGRDSETTKRLAKLATGHEETMGYISKIVTYLNQLQIARETK